MKTSSTKWIICPLMLALLAFSITACNKSQEPLPMSSPLSSEVSDSYITMKVEAALAENEVLMPFQIDVVTTKGDEALTGAVESQSQIELATEITRNILGVHTIHEHMTKS